MWVDWGQLVIGAGGFRLGSDEGRESRGRQFELKGIGEQCENLVQWKHHGVFEGDP